MSSWFLEYLSFFTIFYPSFGHICLLFHSCFFFFFFKQKTAYEMRISDWSSDVCSSDLHPLSRARRDRHEFLAQGRQGDGGCRLRSFEQGRVRGPAFLGTGADLRRHLLRRPAYGARLVSLGRTAQPARNAARLLQCGADRRRIRETEIGRASCRERGCQKV